MDRKDISETSRKAASMVVFTLTLCLCAILVALCAMAVHALWGLM